MKSKSGESSSKSSSKSKALDGTGRDLTNTSHLPVPILRPVDRDSWTQIEGSMFLVAVCVYGSKANESTGPPTLFIREYHDRYLIPHHFGVNSSTTVSGTGTMGEDGVADDHTNLVWLPAASEEPDLELDLTPLRDSKLTIVLFFPFFKVRTMKVSCFKQPTFVFLQQSASIVSSILVNQLFRRELPN